MKIHYLKLKNYRCFDEIELSLHPELTVIVGANGAGKSSLLDALTVALGPYLSKFDEGKSEGFHHKDARKLVSNKNKYEMISHYPILLEAIGEWIFPLEVEKSTKSKSAKKNNLSQDQILFSNLNSGFHDILHNSSEEAVLTNNKKLRAFTSGVDFSYWRRALNGPKNKTTNKDSHLLSAFGRMLQFQARLDEPVILPILGCYGTGRLWALQKIYDSSNILSENRTFGYKDCFNPSANYRAFAFWFKHLSLAIANAVDLESQGIDVEYITVLREIRSSIVQTLDVCLENSGWNTIHYSSATNQIQVRHKDVGILSVAQLSDGIRSVLALAADIAFRCCKLNGHLGADAVKETPGIVMIDELDLHLHPAWQQTIVQSFRQAFPKIQFILTTHSPQLLTTVDKSSIRVLQWEKTDTGMHCHVETPEYQTLGVASYETLARLMQIDPVPQVIQSQWLSRYRQYIEQGQAETSEAEKLRKDLEAHFGPAHPEILDCDRLLRFQKFKQKSLKQER